MSRKKFHDSLYHLHSELKQHSFTDSHTRKVSDALGQDIATILEHPGDVPFLYHFNLMNTLKQAVLAMETDHPKLTGVLNNVIVTLSNMGI